jgi:predicted DNA-binding transcriptional regulator YafY
MTSRTLQDRLARLDALAQCLSDGAVHGVADLAASLGVSPRTLARDLALLREQGWDLDSASGRGGGIRVVHRWPSGKLSLRGDDALELLMALALSEALGLSPEPRHAGLRRQLARCFAPADRADIARLRMRMRVAAPVSAPVQASQRGPATAALEVVYQAFVQQWLLSLNYVDGQERGSERVVEPQCLLLAWPFWYLLAWDRQRQAVRSFRLDRIVQAQRLPQRFQLRAVQPFWAACGEAGVGL